MGERRTLRFAAEFADLTHWFPASVDDLQHKIEVLAEHCAAVDRDPSTIIRTMGSPVIPVAREDEAAALLERIPPERRGSLLIGTPERCAEHLATYIAAGFTGFTFGNTMLRSVESIGLAGEVLRLLA